MLDAPLLNRDDQQPSVIGQLPPFVVYRDGTVYSVRKLEGDDVTRSAVLLVPSRRVNTVIDTDAINDAVLCYPLHPKTLYELLDADNESWAAAHYWDEAWRLGEMLTALSERLKEVPTA